MAQKKLLMPLNTIKPPFNVNEVAQKAAVESLKDVKFISRSVKHNIFYAKKLKFFYKNMVLLQMMFLLIFYY